MVQILLDFPISCRLNFLVMECFWNSWWQQRRSGGSTIGCSSAMTAFISAPTFTSPDLKNCSQNADHLSILAMVNVNTYIFPPTLVSKYVTWFQNLRCRPHYPLKMVASYFLKEKARSWTVSTNTDSVKLGGLSSQANIWIIQQENLFWRGSGWKQVKEKMISFKQVRRLNSNSSKNKSICTELSCVLGCSGTNKVVVKTTSTKHRLAVLDLDTGDTLYQAVGVWAGGTFPFPLF